MKNNTHKAMQFTFEGDPVPKPRMTVRDRWSQRPVVVRYYRFKDELVLAARDGGFRNDMEVSEVRIVAYMRMPKTWSKAKKASKTGQPHQERPGPDADNVLKAVCDALAAEDVTIWRKYIEKRWDDGQGPRLEVELACDENQDD